MMMSRVVTMDQRQAVRREMIQQMEQEAGLGFVQKSIRGVSCGFSRSFRGTHFARPATRPG